MTSLCHTQLSLGLFFLVHCCQTFSLCDCPECALRREQPTTDTAEILHVKVFLIINAGPPYWQNSKPPVDSHHISLTHCHELFSQNMLSHTHTQKNTCLHINTHMEAWTPQWTYGSALTYLMYMCTYNTHTCWPMAQCIQQTQAICSIYCVGKHKWSQYLCKNVHTQTEAQRRACNSHTLSMFPLYVIWHMAHMHTLQQTHNGSLSAHGPFAVFLLFSVFRPAVSSLSVCSVARQTAPPPPNNKICL